MTTAQASLTAPLQAERRRGLVVGPTARRSWEWVWVALMTVAAGVLRFWALDRPAIWGDEAAVYWRTCGSFAQLLEILKNDGFAPLHYELYWVLQQFLTLTPFVMRFIPAVAAVLMVPTMFWLAKQLVGTRAALVVATYTAVSGHLGWHAHDAKMYSHFWLMCALSMSCFIWWLRKGGATAWWCWVASSVAMVGLHSTGFAIIALEPLMLLAGPRRHWRVFAAYLLGLAMISVGPAVYYLQFNQWAHNIESQGWTASGIAWIGQYAGRSTPSQQLRLTVSQLLFGYDFPAPWVQEIGLAWPARVAQEIPVWLGIIVLVALFPWPSRNRARGVSAMPQPWWRSALYIGSWVILPIYAFYCASFAGYLWPGRILLEMAGAIAGSPLGLLGACIALLIGGYLLAATWRGRGRLVLQGLAVAGTIVLLATCIAWALSVRPPGSVWVTRYMTFIWPAFAIGVIALILRLPGWPIRWTLISLLLLLNVMQCISRIHWRQDAPLDLVTSDILLAREAGSTMQAHFLSPHMAAQMQAIERRYYLFMAGGEEAASPEDFRSGNIRARFKLSTAATPGAIARAVKGSAQVRSVVVWEQVPAPNRRPGAAPRAYPDKLARELPPGWERVSEEVYPFTGRWGWGPSLAWRRCEYQLLTPTTAPATP